MRDAMHDRREERRNAGAYMALARKSGISNGQSHGVLDNETRTLFGRLIAEGKPSKKASAVRARPVTPTIVPARATSHQSSRYIGFLVSFGIGAFAASFLRR
jgi:hypothetical protein